MTHYRFLPWTRQGLAARVATPDPLGDGLASHAELPVSVRVNDGAPVGVDVSLHGPGDVIGVDPRGIVRVEPAPSSTGVEPNYLAAIEFDRPDLPWLFTPARATGSQRLRPWLVLVVLERTAATRITPHRNRPLPSVTVDADELPPLEDSWAWAHTQVITDVDTTEAILQAIRSQPELTVSRLLCPRRLAADTEYLACLVPAFEAGVAAGLGTPPIHPDTLAPAWTADAGRVQLPVYHHWEFATGPAGDFESLARRLKPPDRPLEVGTVPVYVGRADPGLPEPPGPAAVVMAEGALVGPFHDTSSPPPDLGVAWLAALRSILDAGADDLEDPSDMPPIAPPLYGAWPAGVHRTPAGEPRWVREVNLDPRQRIAAGVGVEVVRADQELIVHEAWEQVGEISTANALIDRGRFSREIAARLHQRLLGDADGERTFRLATPAHLRLTVEGATVAERLRSSAVPDAVATPAFRRMTARGGTLRRRARKRTPPAAVTPSRSTLVTRLDAGALASQPADTVPDALVASHALAALGPIGDGMVDLSPIGGRGSIPARVLKSAQAAASRVGHPPPPSQIVARPDLRTRGVIIDRRPVVAPRRPIPPLIVVGRFSAALAAHVATLVEPPPRPVPPALGLEQIRVGVAGGIDPRRVVPARVAAMVSVPDPTHADDSGPVVPFEPDLRGLVGSPRLDRPLSEAVAAHAPEWLLPGIGTIPADTVALLATNPRAVESLMIAANTELVAELLWREYPTRRDATPLRHFWDRADGRPDLPALTAADPASRLGRLGGSDAAGDAVLIVRGELFRRYPNTIVSLVKATPEGEVSRSPADHHEATLRGRIDPDVTFVGFDVSIAAVMGDPGYFIVLQQQPTELRFGFDVPDGSNLPATWRDATWAHLGVEPGGFLPSSDAAGVPEPVDTGGASWLTNAAHLAAIAMQRPVRVAIHAGELLSSQET